MLYEEKTHKIHSNLVIFSLLTDYLIVQLVLIKTKLKMGKKGGNKNEAKLKKAERKEMNAKMDAGWINVKVCKQN